MNATEFNALYAVGTPVFAYPGARPEDIPSARRLVTRTRSVAQTSSSGDPVVWVDGEGAYICLTHVDVVPEGEWEQARAAEPAPVANAADTFPAWLARRFDPQGAPWDGMSDDDRAYWEHQAAAVQRAIGRGGFKAPPTTAVAELAAARTEAATARTATLAEILDLVERFAAHTLERAVLRDLATELRMRLAKTSTAAKAVQ